MTDLTAAAAGANGRRAPPPSLFKYFSPSGTRFLGNWHVRFSQPGAMNDPFEFSPHVAGWGTAEEEEVQAGKVWEERMVEAYANQSEEFRARVSQDQFLTKRRSSKKAEVEEELAAIRGKAYPEMASGVTDMANAGIGVFCLTEDPANLLMWSHYGESHTGFVVEFDTAHEFFHNKVPPAHANADAQEAAEFAAEYGFLRPVTYSETRPAVVLTQMSFGIFEVKGTCWSYEREWRMFMPLSYSQTPYRGPYRFPLHLWPIPKAAVRRVIAGANATMAVVESIRRLSADPEAHHIQLQFAQVDREHFSMSFADLPAGAHP